MENTERKMWDLPLENDIIKDSRRAELSMRLVYMNRQLGAKYCVIEYTESFTPEDYFSTKTDSRKTWFNALEEAKNYYDSLFN